jgi:hypothetical protein
MSYCIFAILKKEGFEHLECTIDNQYCAFQRRCVTEQCIKHTNNFVDCPSRKKQIALKKIKNV